MGVSLCIFAFAFPGQKIQTAGLYAAIFLRRPMACAERISAAIPHARFPAVSRYAPGLLL